MNRTGQLRFHVREGVNFARERRIDTHSCSVLSSIGRPSLLSVSLHEDESSGDAGGGEDGVHGEMSCPGREVSRSSVGLEDL